MDDADLADKEILAMTQHRKESEPEAKPTGKCLWCGDPVDQGKRWCCVSCRDEWDKAQRYENLFKLRR